MNPDVEFREFLARDDLYPPGEIIWDSAPHKFAAPGKDKKNKSAWYVGFSDRKGGCYGDYSRGIDVRYWWAAKSDVLKPPTKEEEAARKKQQREWAAAKKKKQAKAAVEAVKLWEAATPATAEHPYLKAKGIDDPLDLRVSGDTLLVPMKDMKTNAIVNVQRIAEGQPKKGLYGGRVTDVKLTLGGSPEAMKKPIYVAEGFATGWTVHKATGCAVVLAFFAHGINATVRHLRKKYPKARIIIAADNDRFTAIGRKSSPIPNPGLTYAREAAKRHKVEFVVPGFESDEGEPTDFDDLRQREGMKRVKYWLRPKNTANAITTSDADEIVEEKRDEVPEWIKKAPFRCLGYRKNVYYYIPHDGGEILPMQIAQHGNATFMMHLADKSWWEHYFMGTRKKIDWSVPCNALMRLSKQQGVFRREKVRGRGAWMDPNGLLLHLGNRILPPTQNKYVIPEQYDDGEGTVYERLPRLAGPVPSTKAVNLPQARAVLSLFTDLLWRDPLYGHLLAGWTVLAPVCGALDWKPHVWTVGGAGSGKTTVLTQLVHPLLGGMCGVFAEGGSTEAGIRQELEADALPVIVDEVERTSDKLARQLDAILALAKSASSSRAKTLKGSIVGQPLTYDTRSMFYLSSIGGGAESRAEQSRFCVLELLGSESIGVISRQRHWEGYAPRLRRVDVELGRRLVARTVKWLRDGSLRESIQVCKEAAMLVFGEARVADQYGTLIAGAQTLVSNEIPTIEGVKRFLNDLDAEEQVDLQPEANEILHVILQAREGVDTEKGRKIISVGELIDCADDSFQLERIIAQEVAEATLRRLGMMVKFDEGEKVLALAHTSEWVKRKLGQTPFSVSWVRTLRTLKGVRPGGQMWFSRGINCRGTLVPFTVLEEEKE